MKTLHLLHQKIGQHQDKAQQAACNYLEFLLWCKEAASRCNCII